MLVHSVRAASTREGVLTWRSIKDGTGAVVRGVIMSMMLYMPPSRGTAKAVACGGQVVIFAFVYVAVRFTWQIVVLHGRLNLVPVLLAHRSCLLAAQTIYESKNVMVEGFPQAAVIDNVWDLATCSSPAGLQCARLWRF